MNHFDKTTSWERPGGTPLPQAVAVPEARECVLLVRVEKRKYALPSLCLFFPPSFDSFFFSRVLFLVGVCRSSTHARARELRTGNRCAAERIVWRFCVCAAGDSKALYVIGIKACVTLSRVVHNGVRLQPLWSCMLSALEAFSMVALIHSSSQMWRRHTTYLRMWKG